MANITVSSKEISDFKEKCEKWARSRAIVMARPMANEFKIDPQDVHRALAAGDRAAEEFVKTEPFPRLIQDI